MKIQLGTIEIVNPREIWENEEKDFTPWIAQNIEELSKVIGIPIEVEQIEKRVGIYELDIYGKIEGTNDVVVIENQLESSDHKHLGQLITYASGLDASIVIWITPRINDEHKKAIEWLNEISHDETSFFLIRPEVLKIEKSKPAVKFYLEAGPSDFERTIKKMVSGNESKSHRIRQMFWSGLISYCESQKLSWGVGRKTTTDNWMSFAVGKSGFSTIASLASKSRVKAEITINTGNKIENKRIFDEVFNYKEEIETKHKVNIHWERIDNSTVSRIAVYREYDKQQLEENEEYLKELYSWLEIHIEKMRKIFSEYLVDKTII